MILLKNILLFILFNLFFSVSAQKNNQDSSYKFIQNLKKQPYLKYVKRINCDSNSGSILELRICANLELQKQDSLLNLEFDSLINEFIIIKDFKSIKKLKIAQDIWEKYRFAQCSVYVDDDGGSAQMIAFLECAAEITFQRRKDINKMRF